MPYKILKLNSREPKKEKNQKKGKEIVYSMQQKNMNT